MTNLTGCNHQTFQKNCLDCTLAKQQEQIDDIIRRLKLRGIDLTP